MKKWLVLFVIIDFIFVGLVLRISTQNEVFISRNPSSDELTPGQKQKFELVQSFQFTADRDQLLLQSEKLQLICENSSLIKLTYVAVNIAIAGIQPSIEHSFSCAEIKKDQNVSALKTNLVDFQAMHVNQKLSLNGSMMAATQVYRDEDFPTDWKLSEITITGPSNFTINQFEIEKAHDEKDFSFTITSLR